MNGGTLPKVRYFIPCDDARQIHGGGPYTLTRVRSEIPNPLGQLCPRVYAELHFYFQLTNGTGVHTFQIQQVCLRDQRQIFRWPAFTMDLGNDRTRVHEFARQFRQIIFWADGQCEFELYTHRRVIGRAVVDVR